MLETLRPSHWQCGHANPTFASSFVPMTITTRLAIRGLPRRGKPRARSTAVWRCWRPSSTCSTTVQQAPSTTRVYRYGPDCVRDDKDLKDAVALLAEHGRARLEEEGRRRFVVVNPTLYAG